MFQYATGRQRDAAHFFVDIVLGEGEFILEISCFYVAGLYGAITIQTNAGVYSVSPCCSVESVLFRKGNRCHLGSFLPICAYKTSLHRLAQEKLGLTIRSRFLDRICLTQSLLLVIIRTLKIFLSYSHVNNFDMYSITNSTISSSLPL